jgi:acylphosphatase
MDTFVPARRALKRYRIRVSGNVQGVFFRHSAAIQAKRLGLSGIARNESGGTVLIDAEGDEAALVELAKWCSRGPSTASVAGIETNEAELHGYHGFTIE